MTEVVKFWNKLDRSDKLDIIASAIDGWSVSEGFLMIRAYRDGSICAYLQRKLDNHLCVEAVSEDTLISLFGEGHDFQDGDAEIILTWMEAQV